MGVTRLIAKKFINYESEKSPAFKLRKKRAERIKSLILDCYKENGNVQVIDIGGTRVYWNIIPKEFLLQNHVHITVVNLPNANRIPENDDIYTFCEGDGCHLTQFSDKYFHIAHSNSVIEHVGDDEHKAQFAEEINRVANKFYVQTPNYWFPIEPHFLVPFFQWLPKSIRISLVQHFDLGWFRKTKSFAGAKSIVESCDLVSGKKLHKLFPNDKFYRERIGFLTKSFVVMN